MTTEQNESPVPESQGQVQNSTQAQGPGVGHRRRRRRRNKGQAGAPQAKAQPGGSPANGQSAQPAQAAPSQRPPKQQQPKRFFPKSNAGNGNGNGNYQGNGRSMQNGTGGGVRRKSKGRRQQTFVGPMDHSYRGGANGNIAESGSSNNGNMEFRGMPHSGFYAEADLYGAAPVVPVREDAPTKIYCFIEDLFLVAKIQEVSRKLGIKVGFVKADKDIVAKLAEGGEDGRPSLIVFDLNNVGAKPLTLIPKLKTKFKRGTSVIGFLSHLQGDLKVKAIEAGCDMVMPRSAFSQNLPNLLRRHGIEEQQEEMEAIEA